MNTDVVIVGGGIAGLACAVALVDNGVRVIVVEQAAMLGGRARSWTDAVSGDVIDIGPHVVHSEYRNMLALLERLGTRELITWQPRKLITIATKPHPLVLRHWPLPPPLSLLPDLLRAPGLKLRDYWSNNRATWRALKFGEEDVAELDTLSAADYLRDVGVSARLAEWYWAFIAMTVMNVPLARCSAAALLRVQSQLIGYRQLHFGFPAVGLAELYVPHAVRVIENAGSRVITSTQVRTITGDAAATGVVLADGAQISARFCVTAVPPAELATMVPAQWSSRIAGGELAAFEPSPYISCYLWFDRKISQERFWAQLWSPQRFNFDYYDLSRIRRGWSERGSVIASNIIFSHRAHGLSDEALVQTTAREIAEFAPQAARAKLQHAVVNRIPMAITCPTPGSEWRRPSTLTTVPGLLLAGDWTRTHLPSSMESAVRSGLLAAEHVLASLGRPRSLAHAPRITDGLAGMIRRATKLARGQ
jgi:squalene-associated FAD-dependent desaturase